MQQENGEDPHVCQVEDEDDHAEDLLQRFLPHLPDSVQNKPREEQLKYLRKVLADARKDKADEEEKAKKLHEEYTRMIQEGYKAKHEDLYSIENWKFSTEFLKAQEANTKEELKLILKEVHPHIYSFRMLEDSFCERLLEEVAHFEQWCVKHGLKVNRPNSMNNYGAILDEFGFYPALQDLASKYLTKFSNILYPHVTGELDRHHGFIVSYEIGKDTKLDFHVDEADVTLNVCLGKTFKGGELYFGGIRCIHHQQTGPRPEENFEFAHQRGTALFHVGKHRHLAQPILSGERHNLILWMMSSTFRKGDNTGQYKSHMDQPKCPTWCGAHCTHEES